MLYEFSRTELLIGKENIKKLANSTVAVFGIGGVGSFTAEALARSGVGKIVLIDGDCVCVTNINRQLIATSKTIGKPKVLVMKDRISEINPKAEVVAYHSFYDSKTSGELISSDYNYIVDAIDTVTSKVDLIVKAKSMGIPIMSSMGAGNKLDPTKFLVSDIYSTSVCPLAKVMRKLLKEKGVESLKVVYSKEEPIKPLVSEDENFKSTEGSNSKTLPKRQIPGSISFVPSVAGLIIAGEVIKDLIKGEKDE